MAKRKPRQSTARRRAPKPIAPTGVERVVYAESSAVVAALIENDAYARAAIEAGRCVTSALTLAEASRAIIRARVSGRLSMLQEQSAIETLQNLSAGWFIVEVTADVLTRVARRFPHEPVRTLDAVHLATAELMGVPPPLVTVVTRDIRVANNARALGYEVAG